VKQQEESDWFNLEQLHFAAMEGDAEKCMRLMADGYDPNGFDQIGNTPLHHAAEGEHFEAVATLLSHGGRVNALDEARIGRTPLSHVAQTCSLKMAKPLLDAGADPTIRCGLSGSAIDHAKNRRRGDGPRVYELLCEFAGRRP
jgi:ankyrin repeat protein